MFGTFDPVVPLSEAVFAALELLMSDCVLSTEPSTNAILVTNNLFRLDLFGRQCARLAPDLCQTRARLPRHDFDWFFPNFSMNCGALARGVVFKDFEIQVVSEETAEVIQVCGRFSISSKFDCEPLEIWFFMFSSFPPENLNFKFFCQFQSEMRRQNMLQQPSPIGMAPSAALLAMKPTSGTKRTNQGNSTGRGFCWGPL